MHHVVLIKLCDIKIPSKHFLKESQVRASYISKNFAWHTTVKWNNAFGKVQAKRSCKSLLKAFPLSMKVQTWNMVDILALGSHKWEWVGFIIIFRMGFKLAGFCIEMLRCLDCACLLKSYASVVACGLPIIFSPIISFSSFQPYQFS